MGFIKKLLGKKDNMPEVLFGEAAAQYGEHGVLIGRWPRNGYKKEVTIGFAYPGSTLPPPVTPQQIEHLFQRAREAGIFPVKLYAYGGLMRARCDYDGVPADPKVISLTPKFVV